VSETDVAGPMDRESVLPAALAALAESGILYIPIHLVAEDAGNASGPLASFPGFAFLFVGSVCLATVLRRFALARALIPVGLALSGLVQGLSSGSSSLEGTATTVALALFVAFRVVTLAVRDWREPIGESFAIGTTVLLIELLAARPDGANGRLLGMVVPMFFLGSLASRAASVRLATPPVEVRDVASSSRWLRSLMVSLACLAALMALAFGLGLPGGGFHQIGSLLYEGFARVLVFGGFLLANVVLRPLSWLLTRIHIDVGALSRAAENLAEGGIEPGGHQDLSGPSWMERLIGLVFFALLALLLVRTIRRRWQLLEPPGEEEREPPGPVAAALAGGRFQALKRKIRRELPADTVRRWYAEALLLLERKGLTKAPSLTPGEYLRDVTQAFPGTGVGFTALTRAYEDVRYGLRKFDRDALDLLDVHRTMAMQALEGSPALDATAEP